MLHLVLKLYLKAAGLPSSQIAATGANGGTEAAHPRRSSPARGRGSACPGARGTLPRRSSAGTAGTAATAETGAAHPRRASPARGRGWACPRGRVTVQLDAAKWRKNATNSNTAARCCKKMSQEILHEMLLEMLRHILNEALRIIFC